MLTVVIMNNYQIIMYYVEYNWDISLSLVGDEVVALKFLKTNNFILKQQKLQNCICK